MEIIGGKERLDELEQNHIRQYLPAFVDGDPEEATFSTVEELFSIDWVGSWSKLGSFSKYECRESYGESGYMLIAHGTPDSRFNSYTSVFSSYLCFPPEGYLIGFLDKKVDV